MMEVIRVSGQAPDLCDFLREAMLSQRFADVALCCPGGQKFLAHRLVLSAASPYLQEVLLAHSKSSNYCEPITVILADIEGPELAALLGFVYTGSATVPRGRLESFLRAAEALRIRLPTAPPELQHHDDVKDVKLGLNPLPYLHCEQYPGSWKQQQQQQTTSTTDRQLDALELRMWAEAAAAAAHHHSRQLPYHQPTEPVPSLLAPMPLVSAQSSWDKRHPTTTESYPLGEDLSCRENCCKWRMQTRRPVANQVTASPWRQILRPHHSPKVPPIVVQNHSEPVEQMPVDVTIPSQQPDLYRGSVVSPCTASGCCSLSPQPLISKEPPAVVHPSSFYQVPNPRPTSADYYARAPSLPPPPLFPEPPPSLPAVVPPPPRPVPFVPEQKLPVVQSKKPELSLPVSRLCDSLESKDDARTLPVKPEPQIRPTVVVPQEKSLPHGFALVSDDNNNNSSIGPEQQRSIRGTSATAQTTEEHKCDQCSKTFVTRASLKVHLRTHSGEKPFRCLDCGKQFSQLRNYKYHRSVHEGTREFAASCPECGKYFNDRGYLSSHMKIHRNRKEYACAECGKSFNQRVAYNMHVRIHTGLKPHQCEQCGKAFSRKMLLKQHLRTHSGERPYQCQVCHKAFADRSNMTLHTRLHSGLKPYQCTLCSKAFTKKHHLKTHLNYHTGTKPYSCPNCSLRFSQSSNMRTHYKKCALNNPNGIATAATGATDDKQPAKQPQIQPAGSAVQPPALTPPNSDQESSNNTVQRQEQQQQQILKV